MACKDTARGARKTCIVPRCWNSKPMFSFCQCGSVVMVTKKSGFSSSLQHNVEHITVYAAVAANSVVYAADALVLSG